MSDTTDPQPTGDAPGPPASDDGPACGDGAAAELAEALKQAAAQLRPLDPQAQARRWARERSIRLDGTAELLRVLLAALGYPTRDGMSEFSTFDDEKTDPATTRALRRAARAILADLEAAAKAPWIVAPTPDP